ncbi:hypothetical protein FDECE_3080 [Fusarium decemcellulare]|nr:hypothetical protein FDECE_3080 [Fusarium decemcellulare]
MSLTDTKSPSPVAELPSSLSPTSTLTNTSEKRESSCPVHGVSQTPHLDEILKSRSRAELQGLAAALDDLRDENRCAKCAVQTAANLLIGYFQDIREAKKNGQWSKEEKKALKLEIKDLAKSVKADVKSR